MYHLKNRKIEALYCLKALVGTSNGNLGYIIAKNKRNSALISAFESVLVSAWKCEMANFQTNNCRWGPKLASIQPLRFPIPGGQENKKMDFLKAFSPCLIQSLAHGCLTCSSPWCMAMNRLFCNENAFMCFPLHSSLLLSLSMTNVAKELFSD